MSAPTADRAACLLRASQARHALLRALGDLQVAIAFADPRATLAYQLAQQLDPLLDGMLAGLDEREIAGGTLVFVPEGHTARSPEEQEEIRARKREHKKKAPRLAPEGLGAKP